MSDVILLAAAASAFVVSGLALAHALLNRGDE